MVDATKQFEFSNDAIVLNGIDALKTFSRYNPVKADALLKGMSLDEDLLNKEGGILYSKGTEIDHTAVKRLIRTVDLNPECDYRYAIHRGDALADTLCNLVTEDFERLLHAMSSQASFHHLLGGQDDNIRTCFKNLFSSEELLYTFYRIKMNVELSRTKECIAFYRHAMYVAIISNALARAEGLQEWQWDDKHYSALMMLALFHNMACLENFPSILAKSEEGRKSEYYKYSKMTPALVGQFQLDRESAEAFQKVAFCLDDPEIIVKEETIPALYANLVIISNLFCEQVFGIFDGARIAPKDVVDKLNVRTAEGKLNGPIIAQLTLGLKFEEMFDFYQEINRLSNMCPHGTHSWPYPMTGFKSPVLFVCKVSLRECEYYQSSVKAITVIKETGGLEEGAYGRCQLTTPELQKFYDEHYLEIKEDVSEKAAAINEKLSKEKDLNFTFTKEDLASSKKADAPKQKADAENEASTAEGAAPPAGDNGSDAESTGEAQEPAAEEAPAEPAAETDEESKTSK